MLSHQNLRPCMEIHKNNQTTEKQTQKTSQANILFLTLPELKLQTSCLNNLLLLQIILFQANQTTRKQRVRLRKHLKLHHRVRHQPISQSRKKRLSHHKRADLSMMLTLKKNQKEVLVIQMEIKKIWQFLMM